MWKGYIMIKFLLKKFFKLFLGDLSNQEKAGFWLRFNKLMSDVTEAAVRGLKK